MGLRIISKEELEQLAKIREQNKIDNEKIYSKKDIENLVSALKEKGIEVTEDTPEPKTDNTVAPTENPEPTPEIVNNGIGVKVDSNSTLDILEEFKKQNGRGI